MTHNPFVPPAAEGLPLAALDSATEGADRLDASARTPYGRNLLAHALVQLARDGWLRTEPGEGFEPVRDREMPEPEEPPAVSSSSVPSAVDRAGLRELVAQAALHAVEAALGDALTPSARREAIAGIMAVLPAPADRAAVLLWAADAPAAECSAQNRNYESGPRLCIRAAQHHGDHIDERGFHWSDTVAVYPVDDGTFRRGTDVRAELRRMADEAQQQRECSASISGSCLREAESEIACDTEAGECVQGGRPADEAQQQPTHSCHNCEGVDPDTCLMNPDRPAEHVPGRAILCPDCRANGYSICLNDAEQPVPGPAGTQIVRTRPVHAVPLPGSNGISACCGRPPCEFVGERVTRDPDKVTCPGPAAVRPGKEN